MSTMSYIDMLAHKKNITVEDTDKLLKICSKEKILFEINEFMLHIIKNNFLRHTFDNYKKNLICAYHSHDLNKLQKLLPRTKFQKILKKINIDNDDIQNVTQYYDIGRFCLISKWICIRILNNILEKKITRLTKKIFEQYKQLCFNKTFHEIFLITKYISGKYFHKLKYRFPTYEPLPIHSILSTIENNRTLITFPCIEERSKQILHTLHIKLHNQLGEKIVSYKECTCYDITTVKLKEIGQFNGKLRDEIKKIGLTPL